jgi:hypothetical protein
MRAVSRLSAKQKKVYTKKADGVPRKRGRPKKGDEANKNDAHAVTTTQVMTAKRHKFKSRLCGNLTLINHHIWEREQMKSMTKFADFVGSWHTQGARFVLKNQL